MPREDRRWSREEDFSLYATNRRIFRGANTLVVASVLDNHVPLADGTEILEIGSGRGDFYELAPDDYKPRILQTDRWPGVVEANRKRHSDARVEVADVYSLPFSDGRFNTVVGYSVFDTLFRPEDAFHECRRVTKEDGAVIAIQDLTPDPEAALTALKDEGKVPFLTVDDHYNPVLVAFNQQEFERFIKQLPQLELLQRYMDDPYGVWTEMERRMGGTGVDIRLSKLVGTFPLKKERTGIVDYYQQRTEEAMRRAGYRDVQSARETQTFYTSETRLQPGDIQRKAREEFDGVQVTNNIGVRDYTRAVLLVPGRITTKSTMMVTVGRK